jgi:DNA invertase Pin-like site-specific DNA recombinase
MRAGIYARYSSENQRETSIEDQVRLCHDEAARRGFEVASVWEDRELSGQIANRPGFMAMLAAAEARAFDVLVVDDTSRLSRNTADALRLLERLRFWGVHLVARDGIDTTTTAKHTALLYGVKGIINAEYVRTLAEATRRASRARSAAASTPAAALTATGARR